MAYVPHDKLIDFCTDVLASAGVARDQAQVTADCMVRADMRGVASHGVIRLPVYYNRLVKGLIDRAPKGRWVVDKQGTALYDAANGLGHYAGRVAMDRAVQKAADHGIAAVGVFNSTHFGMASYYMLSAVNQGFICLSQHKLDARMAPWGGRKPVLGTNPLAIGAPSNLPFPLILDMATSVVALGKLVVAASEGQPRSLGLGTRQGWQRDDRSKRDSQRIALADERSQRIRALAHARCAVRRLDRRSFWRRLGIDDELQHARKVGPLFPRHRSREFSRARCIQSRPRSTGRDGPKFWNGGGSGLLAR